MIQKRRGYGAGVKKGQNAPIQIDFSKNRLLTFDQATQYTGFARSYMYKLTSSGALAFSKPNGKTIFFDREILEAWMLSNPRSSREEKQIEAANFTTTKNTSE